MPGIGVACDYRAVKYYLAVNEICEMLFFDAYKYISAESAVFRLLYYDLCI